jgi:hypothetical protein
MRYSTFEELHKAFGFDNPNQTRGLLSYEEEQAYVEHCFDLYESTGFAETFATPYTDNEKYTGMKYTVLGRVKEWTEESKEGADLECLPMWNIQFENGETTIAYPEEICVYERDK